MQHNGEGYNRLVESVGRSMVGGSSCCVDGDGSGFSFNRLHIEEVVSKNS